MTKAQEQAQAFRTIAEDYGWTWEMRGSVLTISKRFTPGSNEELTTADMEYGSILDYAPGRGGSVWGTDCGGIGALTALKHGVFRMNKSGIGKAFAAALAR